MAASLSVTTFLKTPNNACSRMRFRYASGYTFGPKVRTPARGWLIEMSNHIRLNPARERLLKLVKRIFEREERASNGRLMLSWRYFGGFWG